MTPITADHFPTSPLALRTADPAKQASIRRFAAEQASAANTVRDTLMAMLAAARTPAGRLAALHVAHQDVTAWRYEAAVRASGRLGTGIAYSAERFRTPITAGTTNYDRIGRVGRLRDGATWDEASRTYQGGATTPAYEAMVTYGQAATDRFAAEGVDEDVLQNWITLPDGRQVAGAALLGHHAPALPDDIDLRCYVLGQRTATREQEIR